jgi:Sap, sulfolipid-1-addressing protein
MTTAAASASSAPFAHQIHPPWLFFVFIEFSLVIIPFAFLQVRPQSTKADLQRAQEWLMSHARQLMAAAALFVGGYMVISGLVRGC